MIRRRAALRTSVDIVRAQPRVAVLQWPSSVRCFGDRLDFAHQHEIHQKAYGKTDKPRVVVQHAKSGNEESHESDAGARRKRYDCLPIHAVRILISSAALVKILRGKVFLANH